MNETNDMTQVSCEESFTADMGPATWANAPEPTPPPEPKGICEDAPCCGCCGSSMDDGYGSPADDAWHDANEYPEW